MSLCYVSVNPPIEVTMIEALFLVQSETLQTVVDAIDIYVGSVPPSATFQVIDIDSTTDMAPSAPTGEANVN